VKEFISHNKSEEAVQSKSRVIRGTAVKNDAGKIAGYVLVSSDINGGSSVTGEMWGMLAASLCTAFIIIVFFYTNMTSRYKKSIDAATKVAT
ncbi:PAS domain-containing sensor histidine kinase, partial [Bacillus sp. SIMBA_005]